MYSVEGIVETFFFQAACFKCKHADVSVVLSMLLMCSIIVILLALRSNNVQHVLQL